MGMISGVQNPTTYTHISPGSLPKKIQNPCSGGSCNLAPETAQTQQKQLERNVLLCLIKC